MIVKIVIGVLVLGGLFFLVSFSGREGGEENKEGAAVAVKNDQGKTVILPANIPTHVPMYPESILENVTESNEAGVRNVTLSLSAAATVPDVNTWYRGALKENGWAVTSDKTVGGHVLLKGENEKTATFMQAANHTEAGKVMITQRIQMRD